MSTDIKVLQNIIPFDYIYPQNESFDNTVLIGIFRPHFNKRSQDVLQRAFFPLFHSLNIFSVLFLLPHLHQKLQLFFNFEILSTIGSYWDLNTKSLSFKFVKCVMVMHSYKFYAHTNAALTRHRTHASEPNFLDFLKLMKSFKKPDYLQILEFTSKKSSRSAVCDISVWCEKINKFRFSLRQKAVMLEISNSFLLMPIHVNSPSSVILRPFNFIHFILKHTCELRASFLDPRRGAPYKVKMFGNIFAASPINIFDIATEKAAAWYI
ncbi:hypothetical protein EGR_00843 [Echinococcus granulosus]|uniref:Uncharacterized protein n=1 Tax=Echinococcus granulosus TaxID=6210 RepID=W6VBS8_ECHGR|nr:hypothetical protein EGR_00843 [Echinococcus granulosus]EUB64299.1 hypothetical protein EGR_00843 [Echinococcus granulosus]